MSGFPVSLWAESTPGSWVLLGLALFGLITLLLDAMAFLHRLVRGRAPVALSILVLIHNQEHRIEGVVRTLAAPGWPHRSKARQWEVLLVDLESTDDTPVILDRLARHYQHIRLLTLPRDKASSACEAALFLCRSPVALLVDLRHAGDSPLPIEELLANWK